MKTLTSTEFRRVYAGLEEPTEVTVLGRLIGTWFPVGTRYAATVASPMVSERPAEPTYSTRPFTPVPKKGKK